VRRDQIVDMRGVFGHPARDGHRVRVEGCHLGLVMRQRIPRFSDLGGGDPTGFSLEQEVYGAFTGLVTAPVASPVRH